MLRYDETSGARVALRRIVVGPLATNCWIVHGVAHPEAIIVDPGADAPVILAAASDLRPVAIVATHHHFDHVLAVREVSAYLDIPVYSHPAEEPVWPHEVGYLREHGHFDGGTATAELLARDPACLSTPGEEGLWDGRSRPVEHGEQWRIGPLTVEFVHTPGHTPGGLSLAVGGHLLTGDTLFPGGPGLTGWPLSDFGLIMKSVRCLLDGPAEVIIHPGHGPDTTVGAERPFVEAWQQRGW